MLDLYRWYEFKENGSQVIWFQHKDDINGFAFLYDNGSFEYEGAANYGYMFPEDWQEPTRTIPPEKLRLLIKYLFIDGLD